MKRVLLTVLVLFAAMVASSLAGTVRKWNETRDGVCYTRMEVEVEGFGCRQYETPCQFAGSGIWTEIGCGWGPCGGGCSVSGVTCYPSTHDAGGNVSYSVSSGLGGTYAGSHGSGWTFVGDGSGIVVIPAHMIAPHC